MEEAFAFFQIVIHVKNVANRRDRAGIILFIDFVARYHSGMVKSVSKRVGFETNPELVLSLQLLSYMQMKTIINQFQLTEI
jgi:hypothetical protein